ncbi:probable mitochondrial glutathione transporter SLC25A40 isoform X2 [Lineus longissimus]|uniref:probable mitochondrial glutathione transporter SLC25A40 isoform X2 n=1 Tax=Lineus longissimus TaxID=88925 RepID=UPI00315DAC03
MPTNMDRVGTVPDIPKTPDSTELGDCRKIRPLQQMIASCSGALLVSLFVTPLDVVKIRLQAQHKPLQRGQCFLYCNGLMDHICICVNGRTIKQPWYKMPGRFNGTLDAFIKITRAEGIGSLWSGLPPTLVMAVPATVIYFTSYDQIKYTMGFREGQREKLWIPAIAGSVARVFAASVISPIELIRTKMQSTQLSYSDIGVAVRDAVSHGGIRSLWSGLGPTILRDVPFSAIYWLGFEAMKSYSAENEKRELTFTQNFMAGATSGTIAAILTLPFDVVKTHRQIELGEASLTDKKTTRSTWLMMRNIYRSQGPTGLFSGLVPRLIKVTPACAIMISTYEYGKSFFRARNSSTLALSNE